MLHGFVNCQSLKLTANRGSIANTDPQVTEELRRTIQAHLEEIDKELHKYGIFALLRWQEEELTLEQEKADFQRRTKSVSNRKLARLDGHLLLEPQNEAELFGLLTTVHTLRPDLFDFEPLDYNTTRGIDIIARNKTDTPVADCTFWYVELKYLLTDKINHGFKHLRWIVCWDFHTSVNVDSEVWSTKEQKDQGVRRLQRHKDEKGHTIYFLYSPGKPTKIQVVRLREFLKERLSIEFVADGSS